MNDAYAELNKLRHVRVDGNAALEHLAEHVDALVYELQVNKQRFEELPASYSALSKVRLYFQNDYRDVELDLFRRGLNETISGAIDRADMRTAANVRSLFDDTVAHCVKSDQLYQTNSVDALQWLQLAQTARKAATKHFREIELAR